MRKNSKYYNNGSINMMIAEGEPVPEGFVPGMVKRSKESVAKSNQKRKQTNLDKYGVEVPQQSAQIRSKTQQTCLERYGAKNVSQSAEIQKRRVETFQERYGVDNPALIEGAQDKMHSTCLERYGAGNPFASTEIQEKIRGANLEKYGVEYPMQSKEVQGKVRQTFMTHYGTPNPLKSEEMKERVKQTNLEKYGVPWACMRPEARAYSNDSGPNREFAEMLGSQGILYEREFHIGCYSYDFKVGNVLIEIDPSYTHNTLVHPFRDTGIRESYHYDKSKDAEAEGLQCIHVFDWDDERKVIEMVKPRERVYARKCEVREVSREDCTSFLMKYHLQGSCHGQDIRLGLYCQGDLVSVMTFGKPRYNKNYQYELIRYCSSKNVIGGAEKLFSHFVKDMKPGSIISYCDRSKFLGTVYKSLGMSLLSSGKPSCHWYNYRTKQHFTDNLLRQHGADRLLGTSYGKGTSNQAIMFEYGFLPVYDCGQDTYVWKNPDFVE